LNVVAYFLVPLYKGAGWKTGLLPGATRQAGLRRVFFYKAGAQCRQLKQEPFSLKQKQFSLGVGSSPMSSS
jgi:hypothetical protein